VDVEHEKFDGVQDESRIESPRKVLHGLLQARRQKVVKRCIDGIGDHVVKGKKLRKQSL
jgi:hypothetical protein